MSIGETIKKLRKKRGLSQKELGEKLGVSASMISQYESNIRKPKRETLEKFARALEVNMLHLLPKEDVTLFEMNGQGLKINYSGDYGEYEYNTYRNRLNHAFNQLNARGQGEAAKRVEELTEIAIYTDTKEKDSAIIDNPAPDTTK